MTLVLELVVLALGFWGLKLNQIREVIGDSNSRFGFGFYNFNFKIINYIGFDSSSFFKYFLKILIFN